MKIALFKTHKHDPLCFLISALTRGGYTHAAILLDEATLTIAEAFYPCVRIRQLEADEVPGIDFFEVAGLTPEKEAAIAAYARDAAGRKVRYSILNLFRFLPFVRPLVGEARDDDASADVFCSEFDFDAFDRAGGIQLLRAHSYEVAPTQLAWSPFLSLAK